ncbi:MAG: GNAT family acetyltransferase [Chloroflexi bacterium]|nr:GNAT family acetyltransferase [Chloroflexota bacterium]
MLIRPFTMSDYPAVRRIWEASAPGVTMRPSDEPDEVDKMREHNPDLFLVAEREGEVIGVIMGGWDGRRGWLHHLAVSPELRNQGIGSALLEAVETRLRAYGCLKVNLMVHAYNTDAQRLYERLGYSKMSTVLLMGKEF